MVGWDGEGRILNPHCPGSVEMTSDGVEVCSQQSRSLTFKHVDHPIDGIPASEGDIAPRKKIADL